MAAQAEQNFCPYCGTAIDGKALFCGNCGQRLDAEPVPEVTGEDKEERPPVAAACLRLKEKVTSLYADLREKVSVFSSGLKEKTSSSQEQTKQNASNFASSMQESFRQLWQDPKQKRLVLGAVAASCVVLGGLFYVCGPTEYHAKRLIAAGDSEELLTFVWNRRDSSLFTSATTQATVGIIELNGNAANATVSRLGHIFRDKLSTQEQQVAVIAAFTHKGLLAPDFQESYLKHKELREALIANARRYNKDHFRNVLESEANLLLTGGNLSRSEVEKKVAELKVWNEEAKVNEGVFEEIDTVLRIKEVLNAVNSATPVNFASIADAMELKASGKIRDANTAFLRSVANMAEKRKVADDKERQIEEERRSENFDSKIAAEQRVIENTRSFLNTLKSIDYYCVKYFNDGTLLITVTNYSDVNLAVISNPDSTFYNYRHYTNQVELVGTKGISNGSISRDVPLFRLVNTWPYLQNIYNASRNIGRLREANNMYIERIGRQRREKEYFEYMLGNRLRYAHNALAPLRFADLVELSEGRGSVPKL